MNEDLNKWFKEKWVNIGKKVDGKHPPCGTSGEKKAYAKCVPAAKAARMTKKEKESATKRKRAAQNDAGRGGKNSSGQGKTPIYVSTKPKNEIVNIEEKLNLFLEKNCPTDASKWSASKAAAKKKFDVYPSAYANGWAAKNYKSKGGGWRTCNENYTENDTNQISEGPCWDGYKQVGMKNKNGKEVPNCVPISETIKKVGDDYAVYPKKGGKRLGTHSSKSAAQKQLAAIEISKQKAMNEESSLYSDWDEYSNYIIVHLNNGKKLKIEKRNIQGGTAAYNMILKAFQDENTVLINKIIAAMTKKNMQEEYPDHPERRDTDSEINYGKVEPEEYDVDNYDDYMDFITFMRGYNTQLAEAGCGCVYEAEYQGRQVKLGKPMRGDVKKFKVYVKNPQGNIIKVNFGDPNMRIKKSNPARRKSFRARHNCDNPGPRTKARYWSCRAW